MCGKGFERLRSQQATPSSAMISARHSSTTALVRKLVDARPCTKGSSMRDADTKPRAWRKRSLNINLMRSCMSLPQTSGESVNERSHLCLLLPDRISTCLRSEANIIEEVSVFCSGNLAMPDFPNEHRIIKSKHQGSQPQAEGLAFVGDSCSHRRQLEGEPFGTRTNKWRSQSAMV